LKNYFFYFFISIKKKIVLNFSYNIYLSLSRLDRVRCIYPALLVRRVRAVKAGPPRLLSVYIFSHSDKINMRVGEVLPTSFFFYSWISRKMKLFNTLATLACLSSTAWSKALHWDRDIKRTPSNGYVDVQFDGQVKKKFFFPLISTHVKM